MKLRSVAAVGGALWALAGCTAPPQPPIAAAPASNDPATINPIDYVVQHACNVAGDFLNCTGTLHAQTTAEVAQYRKRDLPAPTGYQIGDCTLNSDGSMPCEFSYPPFGPFAVASGDGGDLYVTDPGGITRVKVTQDGGKPGVLQHFTGPECGADGWVSFRNDPPTGSWASMVARLNDTPAAACPRRCAARAAPSCSPEEATIARRCLWWLRRKLAVKQRSPSSAVVPEPATTAPASSRSASGLCADSGKR